VAATATVTSADGNYTVAVQLSQEPNGQYVVDLNVSAVNASQDTIDVRVNGTHAWTGLATQAAGG
jgi:hypothetical protein